VKWTTKPSFQLESFSWIADEIIVVSGSKKFDGNVEVLESWKGNLKKGERVTIPELAALAPTEQRTVNKGMIHSSVKAASQVTGSRMVLFLIKAKWRDRVFAGKAWAPAASWGGISTSVVWIEDGQAYAIHAMGGPTGFETLTYLGMTENELQRRVASIVETQIKALKAVKESDPVERAKR
jgi:hypothetical protein